MPTVKENLQELHRVITEYPESKLDLGNYVKHTDCGTIFCAAGLAATLPFFMDQIGMPPATPEVGGFKSIASDLSDMSELWGEDGYNRLFTPHGYGTNDHKFTQSRPLTDKELILARIEYALEHDV